MSTPLHPLAQAANDMSGKLRGLIQELQKAGLQITSASTQMLSAADCRSAWNPGSFDTERPERLVMPKAVKRLLVSFGFTENSSVSVGLEPG